MTDTVDKTEEAKMEISENAPAEAVKEKELEECKKEVEESEEKVEEGADEIMEEEDEETEDTEEKKEEEPANPFGIGNFFKSVGAVDVAKCMLVTGLPTAFYDDDVEIFNECVLSMLEEDFTCKKDSIESITRLTKGGEDEENACRVMVSFKSRVHKHRVMAVKNKANVGYSLGQVESVPEEVVEILKEVEKKAEKTQKEEKEKEKKIAEKKDEERFKDEHSTLPFVIDWDGAPEFQWKIPEGKTSGVSLVIENADVLDLYEPFLYRAALKAQSVNMKMPGRIIDDQPTARHYGTIILNYLNDGEAIRYAMVNLIYFRSKGDRRIKVFLPQTTLALKRKSEFEKRLGRKIEFTETMKKLVIKSTDISLSDCTFGLDEAKTAFSGIEVEAVESVKDSNDKSCFVVTFKTARDAVTAHATVRSVKIGENACRVYALGSEINGDDREGRHYFTRLESIAKSKEESIKKKAEYDEKVAKGEIAPKKTFPKKISSSTLPTTRRNKVPLSSKIPLNKSNGPSFKAPLSSRPPRSSYPPRGSMSSSPSRGGGRLPQRTRRDEGPSRSSRPSPWENRRSGGGVSSSAFNKDDLRMEQMVREQRRQMEMEDRILRQQEMMNYNAMQDRLSQSSALSSSAFRPTDYGVSSTSGYDQRSSYVSPSAIAYNKASGYTPSPAYEPLSSTLTPSHLSNPTDYRSSSFGSSYGKPSSSSLPSSSYDRRY